MVLALPWLLSLALASAGDAQTRIVFIAGEPSHGYGEHEFNAGSELLAEALRRSGLPVDVVVFRDGWPEDTDPLERADAAVFYMDGGANHPVLDHLSAVESFAQRGGGLVFMHYALELPPGEAADALRRWIGAAYEPGFSTNPIWTPAASLVAGHPAARGVAAIDTRDEWYFNLRFDPSAPIQPVLSAVPDDHARENPVWPRRANEHVLASRGREELLAWTLERPGGGRGVGFSGGHYHWNWGHDGVRRLVSNLVAWSAGLELPAAGIDSQRPGFEALRTGQDEREPFLFFDPAELRERFGLDP